MKRIWRGLNVLAAVFGWQFTFALLFVAALLVVALWHMHGPSVAVLSLLLVLMGIRAHDLGEPVEGPQTEYEAYWEGMQWTPEQIQDLHTSGVIRQAPDTGIYGLIVTPEQLAELEASPDWQRIQADRARHVVAFGPMHPSAEL